MDKVTILTTEQTNSAKAMEPDLKSPLKSDSQTFQPSPPKKIGRPRKDKSALTHTGEHWADHMIRLYSEGCGDVEVCKEIKIPYKEFQRRERDDKNFRELVEFGRLARKAWWLEVG